MASTSQQRREKQLEATALDEGHDSCYLLLDETLGASSTNPSPPSAPATSWYYSARIQLMMENRRKYSSEVECEIESSRVHWSELDPTSEARSEAQHSVKVNRKYFEKLKRRELRTCKSEAERKRQERLGWAADFYQSPSHSISEMIQKRFLKSRIAAKIYVALLLYFGEEARNASALFREMDDLVVGDKIAEGGQAEIYEASRDRNDGRDGGDEFVVKVFKAGLNLRDLAKQFPLALLNTFPNGELKSESSAATMCLLLGATVLDNERFRGRFAFLMRRFWGDLRKLIDRQMMQSHNQGPPFTTQQVLHIMLRIASDLCDLHMAKPPIFHRDLKAANVLVEGKDCPSLDEDGLYHVTVADYECSVGVVGTGFWRAPEVLQQLRNRIPCPNMVFTDKCDVYSFGMTCYELVTGRIPFEGHSLTGFDVVLSGNRPKFPHDLDPFLKEIVVGCWHPNPSNRPTFSDIISKISEREIL